MLKMLYTDIDGVLCLSSEMYAKNTKWGNIFPFNKKAVKVYNEILIATGAMPVISSDWRNHLTLEQLGEIFEWQGIIRKPLSITPNVEFTQAQFLERDRCKEILFHVDMFQPDVWVAIDDLGLHKWWTGEEVETFAKDDEHFVWTPRSREGIKQSNIKKELIEKLNI